MIKPEQIPDNVVMSARRAWLVADDGAVKDWKKAIAAAINAWPGSEQLVLSDGSVMFFIPRVKKR